MSVQLILASASPRRQELLDQIGVSYITHPMDIDETPKHNEVAKDYVIRIANEKSEACVHRIQSSLPILAADTSVVIGQQILGKPKNQDHAIDMLTLLSGKTHHVFSAISFRTNNPSAQTSHSHALSITEVTFRNMTAKEIHAYCQTSEPQGKAGSYAIQGLGSIFIQSIKGSFSGVMGLPLYETAELLSQQGIKINT